MEVNPIPASRLALHGGWLAGVAFLVALLCIAAATPGYEHAHQPVSFLGMRGAAHAPWWNVFGFGVPGLLVAAFALALSHLLDRAATGSPGSLARIGAWLLVISGLAFAGNGVFAFDPQAPAGTATRLHVAMLTIALLGFLPATALLALALRRTPGWRALATLGPVIGAATVLSVMERMTDFVPALAGAPGYGQRITLALYFLWLALAAGIALRQRRG